MAAETLTLTVESRSFTAKRATGELIPLTVRKPTSKELEGADLELSAMFNRSLLAGLPPRGVLVRRLRERGLWTAEQEQELTQLREDLAQVDEQLKSRSDDTVLKSRREEIFGKLNGIRRDMDSMLAHTADAKAETAERNYKIAATIVKADGKRLWPTIEAFLSETDLILVERVIYEYMMFEAGLPSEWKEIVEKPVEKPAEPAAEPVAVATT